MSSSLRGRSSVAAVVTAVALCLTPAGAGAQGPEFIPLSQGAFPAIASTWQASALRPASTLLDLYDDQGALFQSYATQWEAPGAKGVAATGQRPLGMPSTQSLVAGAAGRRVKSVKVIYAGALAHRVPTVKAPPEWGFAGRFFAAGAVIDPALASTVQVITRINALDRRGRRLSRTTTVFTNPF